LVLGGDFAENRERMDRSLEIISNVNVTDGIYGVEGNHDRFAELFSAMERHSIHPLSNSGKSVRKGFYIAGLEDLTNRSPDVRKAVKGAAAEDFVLLVSHDPDVTMMQDTTSVDLILSGHTHGGQITFFGIWAPALTMTKHVTDFGHRFMSGWAESRDRAPVYVSNGTGTFPFMPRIFARPQVIFVTLQAASQATFLL
jgi:predicted MPP superfamily phosphohydrolase